jgi:hypothetical protein
MICLGVLLLVLPAAALDGQDKSQASEPTKFTSALSPLFLEKLGSPHALKQETGWQVGGLSSRFSNATTHGALSFTGGLFYSRAVAPRRLLDKHEPIPGYQLNDTMTQPGSGALGFGQLFGQGAARGSSAPTEDGIYQRLEYKANGLQLNGSYASVGEEFKGFDALKQQLQQSDPVAAGALGLGMTQSNYSLSYTGLRGFNFSTNMQAQDNAQKGHKENGLSRTTHTNSIGIDLGKRHQFNLSTTNLVEEWDPEKVKRDRREVETQAMKLSGGLAGKSQFSLGQTLTNATTGATTLDTRQHEFGLQWNEWSTFGFGGSYLTRNTEQTGEQHHALNLNVNAALSSTTKLTGKFVNASTDQANGATVENDQVDVQFSTQLSPGLSLVATRKDLKAPDKGELRNTDYRLAWALMRNLTWNSRYTDDRNSKKDEVKTRENQFTWALSPQMKLTTKLTDVTSKNAGGTNTRDHRLSWTVKPGLTLSTHLLDVESEAQGDSQTLDQAVTWQVAPRWQVTTRLLDVDHSTQGETQRVEYGVTHQLADNAQQGQVSVQTRRDDLPNDVAQERQELAYARMLGSTKSPVTWRMQTGSYHLVTPEGEHDKRLVSSQISKDFSGGRTRVTFGYYNGPLLGAGYLTYRSWGVKPKGNAELWAAHDFVSYHEWGGEITHQLHKNTRLSLKQSHGVIEDAGAQNTIEYGIEQRLGNLTLTGGKLFLAQPVSGGTKLDQKSWWKAVMPLGKPLPAWTENAARYTVFQDGAAWGIADLPKWVAKPQAGVFVERNTTMYKGKALDLYNGRLAVMLDERLFLQVGFERNPVKHDKPNEYDFMDRSILHLSHAVTPKTQVFARYIHEEQHDQPVSQSYCALGMIGQFSAAERFQFEIENVQKRNSTSSLEGVAYAIQYERTLNENDTLVLKYRLNPDDFSKDTDRVRLEGTYRHAF